MKNNIFFDKFSNVKFIISLLLIFLISCGGDQDSSSTSELNQIISASSNDPNNSDSTNDESPVITYDGLNGSFQKGPLIFGSYLWVSELNEQLSVLKQQLAQRRQQLNEVDVTIETTRDTLLFVEKQISIIKPLVDLKQYPETELLNLQRQAKDFEGKIEASIASKLRFETSILEVKDQIVSAKQSYTTKSQTELSDIISQIAEVESRIPALEDRLKS